MMEAWEIVVKKVDKMINEGDDKTRESASDEKQRLE